MQRDFDDLLEIGVLVPAAHVARVDPILRECFRTGGVLGEEQMPVVVEVADDRDVDAQPIQLFADDRHGLGRLVVVDRDANQLGPRMRELCDLQGGGVRIGGVRVGHGLDDDRVIVTDRHVPDEYGGGATPRNGWHIHQMVSAIGWARHVHAVPRLRWRQRP